MDVRREIAELIETLLDLVLRHRQPGVASSAELSVLLNSLSFDLTCSYSPTLSGGDRAMLRALHLLDSLLRAPSASPRGPLAVMSGPLADSRS